MVYSTQINIAAACETWGENPTTDHHKQTDPGNPTPWIDRDIIHQSLMKETKCRKAKKSDREVEWENYRRENNTLKNMTHYKHNQYIEKCNNEQTQLDFGIW